MSPHPEYEDLMTQALFDKISPADRERLAHHLETCAECREAFDSLRATLDAMDERERPDLPRSYWASFKRRTLRRIERETTPSTWEHLRAWWRARPALLPQTDPQWALLRAALVVLLVGVGVWIGRATGSDATGGAPSLAGGSPTARLVLAKAPVGLDRGTARPRLASVEALSVDPQTGRVDLRYRTVTEVEVSGAPDDPAVRRLLRAALLDRTRPAAQLRALQVIERSNLSPSAALTEALTVLIRRSDDAALKVRAVRVLRGLYDDTSLDTDTRSLLVDLVLDDRSEALRVAALQTLTNTPGTGEAGYLHAVRDDPNDYLRTRARSVLAESGRQPGPSSVRTEGP
jgi:hypothetical protein